MKLGATTMVMLLAATVVVSAQTAGTYPAEGVVSSDGVKIRQTSGMEATPITYTVKGDRLTVLGRQGDWYQVELPTDTPFWIHKNYVTQGTGGTGEVRGTSVNVRHGAGTDFKPLGQVHTGRKIHVIQQQGDWVKFTFLPKETGFVSAKYVQVAGQTEVVDTPPPTEGPASEEQVLDLFRKAEALYEAEIKKEKIETWDLSEAEKLYRKIAAETQDPVFQKTVKGRLAIIDLAKQYQSSVIAPAEYMKRLKEREAEIAAEFEKRRQEILSRPLKPTYVATGRVEKLVSTWLKPATHKLMEGSKLVYLLYSNKEDLSAYEGHFAGVIGEFDRSVKWDIPTLRVDSLDVLDKLQEKSTSDAAKEAAPATAAQP